MNPLDQTPSTHDVDQVVRVGENPVLATLVNARQRVEKNWTRGEYVRYDGAVCPVGSILMAVDPDRMIRLSEEWCEDFDEDQIVIEEALKGMGDVAKEAMRLLDEAAIKRHPQSADYKYLTGHAIEWLNQDWCPDFPDEESRVFPIFTSVRGQIKAEVLACYDDAISTLEAA